MFFKLSSLELALLLFAIMLAATLVGWGAGRVLSRHVDALREPLGIVQGALLGLVALVLALGLTMAVGRYETRRTAVVEEANAIGTTYLRAQTLREPQRSRSLELLRAYTDEAIEYSETVPESSAQRAAIVRAERLQRGLWRLAGEAMAARPVDSAPRLYVETLNETIDMETVRISALRNRVPDEVMAVSVLGAAIALGIVSLTLGLLGRGMITALAASGFVAVLLFVTFDLDRPTRGIIKVPDTPLVTLRASMELPPAASAPSRP